MAQQTINLGTGPNTNDGDNLRDGGDKINDNFTELYAALIGVLVLKGATDCSANPNYPAASKGHAYIVTVAGKIGGASGTTVVAGDMYFALADNAGGTQAAVGTSWAVVEHNLVDPLVAANNLSDLANAGTARTNLGLGTMATQASSAVAITGGTIGGITALAVADGGTGASTDSGARTNLGLVIGTHVQGYSANLTTYAGITPAANVQSILGAANYAAIKTLLALVPGTDVQAYNANLTTYAGIAPSANVQTLLGAANYAAFRTSLGLDTMALQAASAVTITGGSLAGITGLGVAGTVNTTSFAVVGSLSGTSTNPIASFTSAWSTTGIAQGLFVNITSNSGPANSSSTLLKLQMGGVDKFTVRTDGFTTITSQILSTGFYITSKSGLISAVDGDFTLTDAAGTTFNKLNFGGTSTSFPALKRNAAGLEARLANDSAFTSIKGKLTTDTAYSSSAIPTATGYITIYDSTGTAYRVPCAV